MKKHPLEYFRNDPWPVRVLVLIVVRFSVPAFVLAAASLLAAAAPTLSILIAKV